MASRRVFCFVLVAASSDEEESTRMRVGFNVIAVEFVKNKIITREAKLMPFTIFAMSIA